MNISNKLKALVYPLRKNKQNFVLEKSLIFAFFIFYLLASQVFLPYAGRKDIYPFFDWELFSHCSYYRTVPEFEISFIQGQKQTITNKRFKGKIHSHLYHLMQSMLRARKEKSKKKEDMALEILLSRIHSIIQQDTFEYKIFKSKVNLMEYAKNPKLKKDMLFREGRFEKEVPP